MLPCVCLLGGSILQAWGQNKAVDTPSAIAERCPVIYQDDFETDLSKWVVEQAPGGNTSIENGHLDISDNKGCTVWFEQKLKGPVMIEYTATMIDAGASNDRVSDLNCFWMAIDPQHSDDLFADGSREGIFKNYHKLRTYYVGYGGNNNSTTRFRRYEGNGRRPMLPEHDLSSAEYMNIPNQTVKIQIIADDSQIRYFRAGELIFDFEDAAPYTEGWFGFRTVRSHLTIDQFKVYDLSNI